MQNSDFIRGGASARGNISGVSPRLAGANLTRQTRFEARADRRLGNWDILAFPTPWLWFYDGLLPLVADDDDDVVDVPAIIDLWG